MRPTSDRSTCQQEVMRLGLVSPEDAELMRETEVSSRASR